MKRDPSIFKDPKKGNVSNAGEDVMTMSQRLDSIKKTTSQRLDTLEETTLSLQEQIKTLTDAVRLSSLETKALSLQLTQMQRGQAAAAEVG